MRNKGEYLHLTGAVGSGKGKGGEENVSLVDEKTTSARGGMRGVFLASQKWQNTHCE
jgi:hypothetical protein